MARRERSNSVSRPLKRFDELYREVLEEAGGTLELPAGTEAAIVSALLGVLPGLVAKFGTSIRRARAEKDEVTGAKLFQSYLDSAEQGSSLEVLNRALRLTPAPPTQAQYSQGRPLKAPPSARAISQVTSSQGQPLKNPAPEGLPRKAPPSQSPIPQATPAQGPPHQAPPFTDPIPQGLDPVLDPGAGPPAHLAQWTSDDCLLAQIYLARSTWFSVAGDHESCILDAHRAIRLGHSAGYRTLVSLAMANKGLGRGLEANALFQAALQALRGSSADNALKSVETMKIVKELKELRLKAGSEGTAGSEPRLEVYGKPSQVLVAGSDALELQYSPDLGRHLSAKRDIPPGGTLIVDPPYSWSLYPKEYPNFCQHCCRRAQSSVPCQTCSAVVFCSEECLESGGSYHGLECSILRLLDSSAALGDMGLLCYRTITLTGLGPLRNFLAEVTELGLDREGQLDPSSFSSVYALTTNGGSRGSGDILKRALAAVYLTLCLRFMGFFSGEDSGPENGLSELELKVAGILLRLYMGLSCNAYGLTAVRGTSPRDLEIREIGGAIYPTVSLTNHSCAPNVYRYVDGKVCVVKALEGIPAGAQVLDSYGPVFTTEGRGDRHSLLARHYFFSCSCPACVGDWPLYAGLPNEYECGRPHQRSLAESEKKYKSCRASLISGDGLTEDIDSALSAHLSILTKCLAPPHKLIVEGQEALKLLWNLALARKNNSPP